MKTTTLEVLVFAAISLTVFAVVMYSVIKNAVKAALDESKQKINHVHTTIKKEDTGLSMKQKELQRKYERGELTIDEYKQQWAD